MDIDIKKIVGNNVKKLREYVELSQIKFSEIIDLQMQSVSQIENSKSYPSSETINSICEKFNISPAVLFTAADYFSKQKLKSKEELTKAINLSLTELKENELQFVLEFIALLSKQNKNHKIN